MFPKVNQSCHSVIEKRCMFEGCWAAVFDVYNQAEKCLDQVMPDLDTDT